VIIYRHETSIIPKELLATSATFRRRLIVTDTVFSMSGDCAPLYSNCRIGGEYDAMLAVTKHTRRVSLASRAGVVGEPDLRRNVSMCDRTHQPRPCFAKDTVALLLRPQPTLRHIPAPIRQLLLKRGAIPAHAKTVVRHDQAAANVADVATTLEMTTSP